MHQNVTASVAAPASRVAGIIGDLGTYADWLDLVVAATPLLEDTPDDPTDRPAWLVTIRAKVGPFARSKQLRMVRTVEDHTADRSTFRFERSETDGRQHSAWTLEATVEPSGENHCFVTMDLRYDGGLWTAPLEPILGSVIDDAGPGLEAYATR